MACFVHFLFHAFPFLGTLLALLHTSPPYYDDDAHATIFASNCECTILDSGCGFLTLVPTACRAASYQQYSTLCRALPLSPSLFQCFRKSGPVAASTSHTREVNTESLPDLLWCKSVFLIFSGLCAALFFLDYDIVCVCSVVHYRFVHIFAEIIF